jgi:hypothetical protein
MTPVCSICNKRDSPSYYKVARVTTGGAESPLTMCCSVRCLFQWSYQYASLQGARMVWTAKEAIKKFFG